MDNNIIVILWDYTGDSVITSEHNITLNLKFKDAFRTIMENQNKDDNFINKLSSLNINFSLVHNNTIININNNNILYTLEELGVTAPGNYRRVKLIVEYRNQQSST